MSSISSIGGNSNWSQTSMVRGNRPPPPTDGGDPSAMFKKIDTDGSGGVDASELQTMFTDMAGKMGKTGSTGSTPDASQMIKDFDADGDGSLNQDELGKGMQSLMPPPNTMDFARQRSAGTGSTDSADGSASMQQTMQDLLSAIDTNQDGSIDKSEMDVFKQIATEEAGNMTQTSSSSSSSSSSDSSSSSSSSSSESASRQSSMEELARMVIQRYASMAADTTQSSLTSLSVAA